MCNNRRTLTQTHACLADTYIKNDVLSIEESIVNHVEYTMARSRYKFDDQEAYMATAYSLRDRLIESWNDTQAWFKWVSAPTPLEKGCTKTSTSTPDRFTRQE